MKENNNSDSNSPILNIFESKKNIIQNIDEINKSYSKHLLQNFLIILNY